MNVWQKFKGWIAKKMNFTVETSPAMKEESFLEWLGVKRKNKGRRKESLNSLKH